MRNGERGTVLAHDAERGTLAVRLDDGRTVALSATAPLTLDHAYAATGHSAQGLGAGTVLLDRDSASLTASERQLYTDVTRAKSEVVVYTDSAERLAEAVERQVDKSIALEEPSATLPGATDHLAVNSQLGYPGERADQTLHDNQAPSVEQEGPEDRAFDEDGRVRGGWESAAEDRRPTPEDRIERAEQRVERETQPAPERAPEPQPEQRQEPERVTPASTEQTQARAEAAQREAGITAAREARDQAREQHGQGSRELAAADAKYLAELDKMHAAHQRQQLQPQAERERQRQTEQARSRSRGHGKDDYGM